MTRIGSDIDMAKYVKERCETRMTRFGPGLPSIRTFVL